MVSLLRDRSQLVRYAVVYRIKTCRHDTSGAYEYERLDEQVAVMLWMGLDGG